MRDLRLYHEKRDPERTPEPFGEEASGIVLPGGSRRGFVVQQHDARRMHWDLRLEIDGVLVSWAIPRGPSLDPKERRLAVQTEDHPLEYAHFEGVIPEGNYGAGAMIVWDQGAYQCVDGRTPGESLAAGKLDLLLHGHKLIGRFALVRTKGGGGRDWLLLKKGAPPAEPAELVEREPGSVLSGLRVDELAEGVSRDEELEARLAELAPPQRSLDAAERSPMLASRGDAAFSGKDWLFELKYDGARVIAAKTGGDARLYARSGGDRTRIYPELARAVAHLPLDDFVIDGEVVALDDRGRSSFERLQRRFTQRDPAWIARAEAETPVVLYAFDLLAARGRDLRGLPLHERKALLARFVPRLGQVRFADHVEGDGEALFAAAAEHQLEGVVAKQADSVYESGRRSKKWRKLKVPRSARLAIVGWAEGRGSRKGLGSLVLAWHDAGGQLVYAGNVGSGLDERSIDALLAHLEASRVAEPAFQGAPTSSSRGIHFARPELVCEVRFTEVTSGGLLRHPVFAGLCEGVAPEDCSAPMPRDALPEPEAPREPASPELQLTRLDKVFWPVEGYTKRDLLAYYEAIWPWLAPYLADRPVVLTRYPDGIEGKHFYQKNAPGFTPEWVGRREIDGTDYFLCDDLRTLLYVINSGAIPLHVWSARCASLERPDWLILDLDPKQAPFEHVVEIARHTHALLAGLGVTHYAKTSGQDGLHILLPLAAQLHHDEARALAEVLARTVVAELPGIATVTRPLAARGDKVYVDFLQNGRGKLIAAPFSVRPRPAAPVSTPLTWRQVGARLDPTHWTIRTTPARMRRSGDPMRGVLEEAIDVSALLEGLLAHLERAGEGEG